MKEPILTVEVQCNSMLYKIPSSSVVKFLEGENGPVPTVVSAITRNSYTVSGANKWTCTNTVDEIASIKK